MTGHNYASGYMQCSSSKAATYVNVVGWWRLVYSIYVQSETIWQTWATHTYNLSGDSYSLLFLKEIRTKKGRHWTTRWPPPLQNPRYLLTVLLLFFYWNHLGIQISSGSQLENSLATLFEQLQPTDRLPQKLRHYLQQILYNNNNNNNSAHIITA